MIDGWQWWAARVLALRNRVGALGDDGPELEELQRIADGEDVLPHPLTRAYAKALAEAAGEPEPLPPGGTA